MIDKQKGFTLLEILVVIGIIGVLTGITSDIFIRIIRGSNKANIVTEIKQNGDSVLNQIDRILRNADSIVALSKRPYTTTSPVWDTWQDPTLAPSCTNTTKTASRDSTFDICALIVKNPAPTGGYSKIEFHLEKEQECTGSPFTDTDRVTGTPTTCNGNIQLTLGTDSELADLESSGITPTLLTNTEKTSGVSVTDYTIQVIPSSGHPTLVRVGYTLAQGIAASSRVDAMASVDFETTVSLRTY